MTHEVARLGLGRVRMDVCRREVRGDVAASVIDDDHGARRREHRDRHACGDGQGGAGGELGAQRSVGDAGHDLGLVRAPEDERAGGIADPEPDGDEPQQQPRRQEDAEPREGSGEEGIAGEVAADHIRGDSRHPGDSGAHEGHDDAPGVDRVPQQQPAPAIGVHPALDRVHREAGVHRDERRKDQGHDGALDGHG